MKHLLSLLLLTACASNTYVDWKNPKVSPQQKGIDTHECSIVARNYDRYQRFYALCMENRGYKLVKTKYAPGINGVLK